MVCFKLLFFSRIKGDYHTAAVLLVGHFMLRSALSKWPGPERIAWSIPKAQNRGSNMWTWLCVHLIQLWRGEGHLHRPHYSEKVRRVLDWEDPLKHHLLLVKLPAGSTEILGHPIIFF